jgi:hypothetical protein
MIANFNQVTQLPDIFLRIISEAGWSGHRMYHSRTMAALALLNALIRDACEAAGILGIKGLLNRPSSFEFIRCINFRSSYMGLSAYIKKYWGGSSFSEETIRTVSRWFESLGLFHLVDEPAIAEYVINPKTGKREKQIRCPDKLFVGFDLEKALKVYEKLHQVLRNQIERSQTMKGKKLIDLPDHCGVSVHHIFEFLFNVPFKMFAPSGESGFFETALESSERRFCESVDSIIQSQDNIAQLEKTRASSPTIEMEKENIRIQIRRSQGIKKQLGILGGLLPEYQDRILQSAIKQMQLATIP